MMSNIRGKGHRGTTEPVRGYQLSLNLLMPTGVCSVNRQSLDYVLSQSQLGRAVVILFEGQMILSV